MSNYTDIVSDGGLDPRNAYDKVEVKPYDETPQAMKIRIQRLEKKVSKLKDQLQARNEKIEWLDGVLRYYPYALRTHEEKMRQRAEREELQMLRLRVEEQRLAIKQLNNELIEARIKQI